MFGRERHGYGKLLKKHGPCSAVKGGALPSTETFARLAIFSILRIFTISCQRHLHDEGSYLGSEVISSSGNNILYTHPRPFFSQVGLHLYMNVCFCTLFIASIGLTIKKGNAMAEHVLKTSSSSMGSMTTASQSIPIIAQPWMTDRAKETLDLVCLPSPYHLESVKELTSARRSRNS